MSKLPQVSPTPAQSTEVLPGIVCPCMKAKLHGTTISGIGRKAA